MWVFSTIRLPKKQIWEQIREIKVLSLGGLRNNYSSILSQLVHREKHKPFFSFVEDWYQEVMMGDMNRHWVLVKTQESVVEAMIVGHWVTTILVLQCEGYALFLFCRKVVNLMSLTRKVTAVLGHPVLRVHRIPIRCVFYSCSFLILCLCLLSLPYAVL